MKTHMISESHEDAFLVALNEFLPGKQVMHISHSITCGGYNNSQFIISALILYAEQE